MTSNAWVLMILAFFAKWFLCLFAATTMSAIMEITIWRRNIDLHRWFLVAAVIAVVGHIVWFRGLL